MIIVKTPNYNPNSKYYSEDPLVWTWRASLKILVTGAAGFIGGNLTQYLYASGIDVQGIDNFSNYYNPSMKVEHVKQAKLLKIVKRVDICDRRELESCFRKFKPTHVVHLAAQGGVRASRTDPMAYLESNQIGFLNALQLSEKFKVEKFIYSSSSSVYGDNVKSPFKESDSHDAPKSLYALSKLSNELISKYLPTENTQRIGLRFFTVYGPWGRPDMAVFRLLASSLLAKDFNLTANLEVKRDFTFVDDVIKVILEMIQLKERFNSPEIFNVAGGNPHSLSNLFQILSSMNIKVNYKAYPQDDLDVKLTHGSVDKLHLNGFTIPNTSLSYGVDQTWSWLISQPTKMVRNWLEYK